MRPHFDWRLRSLALPLGARTLVMGVVNVTPDSFSDGGEFYPREKAVAHALQLLEEGADILDVGGESTRPGKRQPVSEAEEQARVLPVIEGILRERPDAVVSVDTYRASTARRAVATGAEIINDVSALAWDPEMAPAVAQLKCACILMHMRGRPEEWRTLSPISAEDLLQLVSAELKESAARAVRCGVQKERLLLDPGFGFGKNFSENFPLLARFQELSRLGFPLLSGTSRKSFVGRVLARKGEDAPVHTRLYGTLATVVASVLNGAHVVRVHDVRPAVDAVRIADQILLAGDDR